MSFDPDLMAQSTDVLVDMRISLRMLVADTNASRRGALEAEIREISAILTSRGKR